MFKNQNTFGNNTQPIQHQDLNQAKDMKIDDVHVYTMAGDLEEIEHPELKKARMEEADAALKPANLTDQQKSSPFFSETSNLNQQPQQKTPSHSFLGSLFSPPTEKPKQIEVTEEPPKPKEPIKADLEQIELQKQKEITEQRIAEMKKAAEIERVANEKLATPTITEQKTVGIEKSTSETNNALPKKSPATAFAFLAIIFILLIIGAGTYYFISTRQIAPAPAPEVIPEKPAENIVIIPEIKKDPAFSVDKANYLILDIANLDKTQITEVFNKYAKSVKESEITMPVEFIIVDLQNNPVDFTTFATKTNLNLSANTLSNLAKNYSVFIFNDAGNLRMGLAIDFINKTKLTAALQKEEMTLAKDLTPIFLATDYKFSTEAFGKSEYKGLSIRYQNIVSPESLSIDYALTDKQLVFGTTKMTLRSIIDKLIPTTTTAVSEDTTKIDTTPTVTTTNTEQPVDNLSAKN